MIKINGYWYSHQEVKEALEKKGYAIYYEERAFGGIALNTWVALKDGAALNMADAARMEFEKKPPLI